MSVLVPVIVATITAIVTLSIARKNYLNDLDDKSEWRQRLTDVATKPFLKTEDVFTIRTFDSSAIPTKFTLTNKDRKKMHLYTRYLLKNHWEVNQISSYNLVKKADWNEKREALSKKVSDTIIIYDKE